MINYWEGISGGDDVGNYSIRFVVRAGKFEQWHELIIYPGFFAKQLEHFDDFIRTQSTKVNLSGFIQKTGRFYRFSQVTDLPLLGGIGDKCASPPFEIWYVCNNYSTVSKYA